MAKSTRTKRLVWENKWSGERGYVKVIRESKGYFENTFDVNEARKFKSDNECAQAIALLEKLGETQNNNFYVIDVA